MAKVMKSFRLSESDNCSIRKPRHTEISFGSGIHRGTAFKS